MTKELEVKVLNIDIDHVEKKIINLGGKVIAKELQVNTLIDSHDRPIKSYIDAYLRIRETKDILNNTENITLTLKKNIKNKEMRENVEINAEVSDKESILQILNDLGFDKIDIGYKERTSYELYGARIDLDIWDEKTYPYPYMEIEVESKDTLDDIVRLLEIPKERISTKSIVELRKDLGME